MRKPGVVIHCVCGVDVSIYCTSSAISPVDQHISHNLEKLSFTITNVLTSESKCYYFKNKRQ